MLKKTCLALGALALLLAGRGPARADIPGVSYFATTGHFYKVYSDSQTWANAKAIAQGLGGYLAVVTTAAEHNFISGTLGARSTHLGATDEVTEGTWLWINGETWNYTAWTAGEPNNSGGEHYLSYNTSGGWNDIPANYQCGYVVEWNNDPNITAPPPARGSFSAVVTTSTRIDLSWTDPDTTEQAVEVQRMTAGGAFSTLATLAQNAVAYADTTVLPGGTYTYRVRATNSLGASSWSTEQTVTTSTPLVTDLAASVLSNRTVELTWTDASAVETQIAVQRGLGSPAASFTQIAVLAPDTTSYVDGTVSPDTSYSYRLQASSAQGPYAPTGQIGVRTPPGDPSPGTPVVRNGTEVTVAWTAATGSQTGYEVQRGLGAPGTNFQTIAVLAPDKVSFVDSTAVPETVYSYRIRSLSDYGPSEWSAEIPVTTPPYGPSGFSMQFLSTTTAGLAWTDVSAIEDGYRVQRQEKGDPRWITLADLPPNSVSYSDPTARQDVVFDYRVAAFDHNGESAWGDSGEVPAPAAMVIDRVTIARSKAKPPKPAKLQAAGSFDTGVVPFEFAAPGEIRIGATALPLTAVATSKKGIAFTGTDVSFVVKPSAAGSSRATFVLTVTGPAAEATPAGGALRIWFSQKGLVSSGAVTLAGDKFIAGGKTGALLDPPLALDAVAGSLTVGATDRLTMKCRFPAGPVPDAASDVTIQVGALRFTAAAAQFVKQGEKLVFSKKDFGGRKILLDYHTGVVTVSLAGVELGAFAGSFDPGELIVTIGTTGYRDRPVYAVSKKGIGY